MRTIRYLTAVLLLWPVIFATAQDNKKHKEYTGYVAFSGGLSFPMDKFSLPNSSPPGGYALPGGAFNISIAMTPAHFPFGFAAMGGYYFNLYDFNGFLKNIQASDLNPQYATSDPNADNLYYVGVFAMAGIYKEILLGKIAFDIRLLGGSLSITTPEVNYYAVYPSSTALLAPTASSWDIYSAHSSAFSYDWGITARIKRPQDLNVFLNFDYIHSNIPTASTVIYADRDGNKSTDTRFSSLAVSFISFSIGLGYDIGK